METRFDELVDAISSLSPWLRLIAISTIAILTHLIVVAIRRATRHFVSRGSGREYAKLKTIGTLTVSVLVFSLYFLAVGLILRELGVSLTTYLASASVIGLAIGFGSQGVVQDVVTGLTFIFSDLVHVGDLVEISGVTGIVRGITMRFIELQTAKGATVHVPNRSVVSVIDHPRGYARCVIDVTLPGDGEAKRAAEQLTEKVMRTAREQFSAIMIAEPSIDGRIRLESGREVLRVQFRIWPGQSRPMESVFVEEMLEGLRRIDPGYRPWMIAVSS